MSGILKIILILSLIVCCILICGCINNSTQLAPGSPTSTNISIAINYSSLSADEKRLVNIAMGNDTIQNELKGRKYVTTGVNVTNYSSSMPFGNGWVSFDLLYPDGSVDYHMVALVDFQNNRVLRIIYEKPPPRSA